MNINEQQICSEYLSRPSCHDCYACSQYSMVLDEFERHISTAQHKAKLKILKTCKENPVPLINILGQDLLKQLRKRNKIITTR